MADEGMLKMSRTDLSEWNQREFIRYLFTGDMATGLRIVENNTMRWKHAHMKASGWQEPKKESSDGK